MVHCWCHLGRAVHRLVGTGGVYTGIYQGGAYQGRAYQEAYSLLSTPLREAHSPFQHPSGKPILSIKQPKTSLREAQPGYKTGLNPPSGRPIPGIKQGD